MLGLTSALLAFLPTLGATELIIILAIVLVIFGPRKLPEIGKAIGQGIRELRRSSESKEEPAKEKEKEEEKKETVTKE